MNFRRREHFHTLGSPRESDLWAKRLRSVPDWSFLYFFASTVVPFPRGTPKKSHQIDKERRSKVVSVCSRSWSMTMCLRYMVFDVLQEGRPVACVHVYEPESGLCVRGTAPAWRNCVVEKLFPVLRTKTPRVARWLLKHVFCKACFGSVVRRCCWGYVR